MSTIARVGFCAKCAKEHRPRTGQTLRLFGSTRNKYFPAEAQRSGLPGFVPHIYRLDQVIGQNVIVYRICCMDECGTYWHQDKGIWRMHFNADRWERLLYTLTTWNALVLYKHDPNYEI